MTASSAVDLLDLSQGTAGLYRDGSSDFVTNTPGPPRRVPGLVVGAPIMTRNAPHGGEMHPDGDELLYLISGSVSVVLELPDETRTLEVGPGQAVIVPKGVWHRVVIHEPSQLVHLTPGPGGEHRPLSADTA
jgi:mannose-6-phosphate isomerase-like protein (cupin superfamily)